LDTVSDSGLEPTGSFTHRPFVKLFVPSVGQGLHSARNSSSSAMNAELYRLAQTGRLPVRFCSWVTNDGDYCVPTQLSDIPSLDAVVLGSLCEAELLSHWLSCRQGDFNSSSRRSDTCSVSVSGSMPFVEGKHVRAFTILSGEVLLRREHDKFTTARIPDVGATKEFRIVMQEVVDLNKHRKCVAALLAPGVVCAHSTTVHSMNWTHVRSHPELQRLEPVGGLPDVPPQVLFMLALLGSKLLEWILRTRDRSDHVSKTALQRLPFPSLLLENKGKLQVGHHVGGRPALEGTTMESGHVISSSLSGGDSLVVWKALESLSIGQLCQHVVQLCSDVLLGNATVCNELDAAICMLYGVSYNGYLFVLKQFQQLDIPVSNGDVCDSTAWPSDADFDVWCARR
jgi:hypothetical protein